MAEKFLLSRKWQYFLVFFGVFVGTALFYMFLSVQIGIKSSLESIFFTKQTIVSVEKNPENHIEINDELLHRLEKIPEVQKVYKETALLVPFSFDISLPFSKTFSLDLYFIYGIDDELFSTFQEYDNEKPESVPVLVNPLSVDIINSFVQTVMSGFVLSNDFFLKKYVSAEFGKSTFLPSMSRVRRDKNELFVSGFSSFAPMVGVAIPLSKVRALQKFFGESTTEYSKFHVLAHDGVTQEQLKKILENMGMKIKPHDAIANKISEVTSILQWVLLFSSSITLLLSFLFLFSVLQVVLIEQKQTIGILQAMGVSKKIVSYIFALQSGGVAFVAIVSGLVFGSVGLYGLQIFWRTHINLFLFPPEIFTIDVKVVLGVFVGLICILLAVLYSIIRRQMKATILENIME